MYTIVAQNTNYSWLKGTKCCSMNNNLARIQPAKAGLFKTKISNTNFFFSFGWFSLEFENRWNTGKISLSDILFKSKLPLPSLCCVCSLNASSWLGGNYFQILAVVCAPPRSGQHAHSRALFFTHSLTKKGRSFQKEFHSSTWLDGRRPTGFRNPQDCSSLGLSSLEAAPLPSPWKRDE